MRLKSLSARLLLTSLGWSAFALIATGLVLTSAFRESVEKRFDDTLNVYLSILIGQLADMSERMFQDIPPDLGEPRFVLPFSGWYWVVTDAATGTVMQTSESLAGDTIEIPPDLADTAPGMLLQTYGQGPTGDTLRIVARRVAFEDGQWFNVLIGGLAATIEEDTARFTQRLAIYLGMFAMILVTATFIQWRISLRPLKQLGSELQAIHEGRSRYVGTRYPLEIAPVAEALNQLIDSNHATLERARQHVGNLAHALKTPLSVLLNDAGHDDTSLARSVREQALIMQRQVRYYLERAQMAAKERVIGTVTHVSPALERLHRAMARLAERSGVIVHLDVVDQVRFAGEQQDLEEIVGNLVDNAIKWAESEVVIEVRNSEAKPASAGAARYFEITIDDDGPGLSEEESVAVLSRGKRLDESKPGSGLGLSIVSELVELYGGALRLKPSPLGGLRVIARLPRA
ncbi:ATP-binding protein [Acuticoccus kandeliae]|uniref:ATP-binding protein n=1 Tax=Acuticoccus kandeliae TaxID=2073160 RepID=UPI000D3E7DDD|nr:ATP-binding protein [Acuticoccus kandeliae]